MSGQLGQSEYEALLKAVSERIRDCLQQRLVGGELYGPSAHQAALKVVRALSETGCAYSNMRLVEDDDDTKIVREIMEETPADTLRLEFEVQATSQINYLKVDLKVSL